MTAAAWDGRRVRRIRDYWQIRIADAWAAGKPLGCYRCEVEGRGYQPLDPAQPFDVDHRQDRDTHPELTWSVANTAPSHVACNRAAGARIANLKRAGRTRRIRRWPT